MKGLMAVSKVVKMLFGPINLDPNPAEWIRHDQEEPGIPKSGADSLSTPSGYFCLLLPPEQRGAS
jgi:hypothetical protein